MSKTAFIPAAGLGTRLAPLTDTCPKALVCYGGKPLLYHVIMKLKATGYDRFVVNVHHFAEKIIDYCSSEADFNDVTILISDERDCLMDTGGGILKAEHLLRGCGEFLVHNVDIVSEGLDYNSLSLPKGCLASLLMSARLSSSGLFFDENNLLRGWKNFKTNETKGLLTSSYAAFDGISIMSEKIFERMNDYCSGKPVPFSVIDFYLSICSHENIHCDVRNDISITDIGKIENLQALISPSSV